MDEKTFKMTGRSRFKTFAYMLNVAHGLADTSKEYKLGSNHTRLAAVMFSAFSIEAFLNDIGEQKLTYWSIVEPKLTWRIKLDLILHEIGFEPDFGCRPYQTLQQLFQLRDKLAHGKSVEGESNYLHQPGKPDPPDSMTPDWLKTWTNDEAVARVIEDVRKIIHELAEKAGFGSFYWASISEGSFSGGRE